MATVLKSVDGSLASQRPTWLISDCVVGNTRHELAKYSRLAPSTSMAGVLVPVPKVASFSIQNGERLLRRDTNTG